MFLLFIIWAVVGGKAAFSQQGFLHKDPDFNISSPVDSVRMLTLANKTMASTIKPTNNLQINQTSSSSPTTTSSSTTSTLLFNQQSDLPPNQHMRNNVQLYQHHPGDQFQPNLVNGDDEYEGTHINQVTNQRDDRSELFASFTETLIWSLLFYPMVLFAAIGNLLIIWIISTKPMMRNIMNQYLINLTLSDFLSVTFNASFNFVFMLHQHWPFGKIYCIANNFIANLTIVSSVSTMMLISIDRYYAIVHPLKTRQTKRRFLLSIGAIWTLSIIFSLPPLIYSDTQDLFAPSESSIEYQHSGPWPSSLNEQGLSLEMMQNKPFFPFEIYSSSAGSLEDMINHTPSNYNAEFVQRQPDFENNSTSNKNNHSLILDSSHSWFLLDLLASLRLPSTLSNHSNEKNRIVEQPAEVSFGQHQQPQKNAPFNQRPVRTLCIMRWPDGVSGFSTYEFLYNWAFLIMFYVIPVLTMVVALVLMSRVLWPGEHIGESYCTMTQPTLINSKRKVVCMLICVISVFALCWLPYHCYFIGIYWWPSLIRTPGIKHIYLAFYWFAMANSLFNPVILFAMNRRIRTYIQTYFKRYLCCFMYSDDEKSDPKHLQPIQQFKQRDFKPANNNKSKTIKQKNNGATTKLTMINFQQTAPDTSTPQRDKRHIAHNESSINLNSSKHVDDCPQYFQFITRVQQEQMPLENDIEAQHENGSLFKNHKSNISSKNNHNQSNNNSSKRVNFNFGSSFKAVRKFTITFNQSNKQQNTNNHPNPKCKLQRRPEYRNKNRKPPPNQISCPCILEHDAHSTSSCTSCSKGHLVFNQNRNRKRTSKTFKRLTFHRYKHHHRYHHGHSETERSSVVSQASMTAVTV